MRLAGLFLIGMATRPEAEARVRRAGERRRILSFKSSLEVDRPVAPTFSFFKNFENFPRILGGLKSVIDYEDGRSRWEAYTPSGDIVAWSVVVTKYVPNHVLAWESERGSEVEVRGLIRFTALTPTRTRLDFEVKYRPTKTTMNDAIRALMAPALIDRLKADIDHARFYLETLGAANGDEPATAVS